MASAPSLGIPDSGRGARRSQGGGSQAKLAFLRAAVTQEPFWADLQPRVALVERGGSLWLNCSTNCPRPERGGLETSLRRNGTQKGLRWLARQLVDIREPETQPVCFFRCARRTLQARGLIRTFREFSAATLLTPLLSLPSRSRSLQDGDQRAEPHDPEAARRDRTSEEAGGVYALGWLQFSWLSAARDGVGGGVQVCRGVCVCVCGDKSG